MRLETEYGQDKQQILIVNKSTSALTDILKSHLKKYDNDVFISPKLPTDVARFDLCFIVNESKILEELIYTSNKKIVFIFINKKKTANTCHSLVTKARKKNIKIINLENYHEFSDEDIEKVLWFSFSRSHELYLHLQSFKIKSDVKTHSASNISFPKFKMNLSLKPRKIAILFIIFIISIHFLFILPLAASTFFHYSAVNSLKSSDTKKTRGYTLAAGKLLPLSKNLYALARPTFLLFNIVIYPDTLFTLNEKVNNTLNISLNLYEEGSAFISLLIKKDKTEQDRLFFNVRLKKLEKDIELLEEDLSIIYQKIPTWTSNLKEIKEKIKEALKMIDSYQEILPHTESILAKDTQRKYIILFANNMELRPGGGFIGSFGILTLKDLSIHELKVYDVYDADGQLSAHVPPPKPIQKYLQQPHWFLRDSAFSPDFAENYKQALYFLDKELNMTDFDGGMIITTTAIQNLLSSMGNLYIPDFKEIVNKDNFYLKAQIYAEKGFFPGSLQKKRFLSAIMDQILINAQNASLPDLLQMIKKSLDEKQAAIYLDNAQEQNSIDALYWSGRLLAPVCAAKNTSSCIVDYIFPVDANLGVNKANFFISKSYTLDIRINTEGIITNNLNIKIKNDSANEVFPGGTYKNYFQVLLPKNTTIKTITKNDTLIEDYDEKDDQYKNVGFYVEIKPQSIINLDIKYQFNENLASGQGAYQLIIQKQIGSPNSDLNLRISFPKNIYMVNQNFSALVKNNNIVYNTTLTSDKIFFMDLIKE
ncbi:MAG: DUF4012 domain-containing protein [Candidatus Roizmanbacteria bacterium]|nr:MAG: DUF4012 domain-containing protein [Candidatus Roizmanbacteria bacterium]